MIDRPRGGALDRARRTVLATSRCSPTSTSSSRRRPSIQRGSASAALRRFVDDLLPLVEVAWVDETLHAEAREALLAAGRRNVSLVDWTSFLVMRRHGVRRAFTFDPDFGAEGFEVLRRADDPLARRVHMARVSRGRSAPRRRRR